MLLVMLVMILVLKEKKIPYFVIANVNIGGVSASFGSLGDFHLMEPGKKTIWGFAGKRVAQGTISEPLPDDFQSASHVIKTGTIYMISHRKDQKNVIDLCSGSGCIGISLDINNKYLNVTLSDVSTNALKVCKINKKNLNSNVNIIQLDLNLISKSDKEYDIIISNPPYISLDESNQLGKNVKYEPDIALFTPKDKPLHFYEKILEFATKNLSKNGVIYLEINPNFILEFNQLLTNYTINHINFKDDFRGKKRLVKLIF